MSMACARVARISRLRVGHTLASKFASFSLMGVAATTGLVATRRMYVTSWCNSLGLHQHPVLGITLVLPIHD